MDYDSWMTHAEKTLFETLIFKYAYFDTMIDVTVKKRERNSLEREFTCEDWSHCLYRKSFKFVHCAISVQSENHKRIIPPRMMSYAMIPYKSTIHLFRGSSTISLLYCRSWTGNCTGSVQKEDKLFFYHGGCTIYPLPWRVYSLSRQQCQRSRSNRGR